MWADIIFKSFLLSYGIIQLSICKVLELVSADAENVFKLKVVNMLFFVCFLQVEEAVAVLQAHQAKEAANKE